MLLFSIVVNRLSFFLVVAVLALLLGGNNNNGAMAYVIYDQGTEVRIEGTGEGVWVRSNPTTGNPTTGLLFDDTTVSNDVIGVPTGGAGILVRFGSKLIAYGGVVRSIYSWALRVEDPGSSAVICDGNFTGGTDFGSGFSAVIFDTAASDTVAIIEIKTGSFTGGGGDIQRGGHGLEIDGPGTRGITLDGMFQGGDAGSGGGDAGCGLLVRGGAMELHGGSFGTGSDGSNPCSLEATSGGTIEVYRGTTFDGDWRIVDGGTIIVHDSSVEAEEPLVITISPGTGTVIIEATLCDGTEFVVNLIVEGDAPGIIIVTPDCSEPPPTIEDCKSSKSSKSKSTKSATAKSSKTAKSGNGNGTTGSNGNGTTGSAKGSKGFKSGKMNSKASSTMRINDENMFYHANGQADEGSAMIGANAMGTSSSSSSLYSLFGTTCTAAALKITTSISFLAMMAFYAY